MSSHNFFVTGWQTIFKTKYGNVEMFVGESWFRLDLTWNDGIDFKCLQLGVINY